MSDKPALLQPDRGQKAIDLHLVDKTSFEALLKRAGIVVKPC